MTNGAGVPMFPRRDEKGNRVVRGALIFGIAALVVGGGWIAAGKVSGTTDALPTGASVALDPEPVLLPAPLESTMLPEIIQEDTLTNPIESAPVTRGLSTKTAQQSISNKCRIPNGSVCYVRAKKVGSSCNCPDVSEQGVIVK